VVGPRFGVSTQEFPETHTPDRRPKRLHLLWFGLQVCLLSACSAFSQPKLPTPLPPEYLPTVVALTLEAGNSPVLAGTQTNRTETIPATDTPLPTVAADPTQLPSPTVSQAETDTPSTPAIETATAGPTATAMPDLPIAGVQIFKPGDLSKVISPIEITAYLRPGERGRVTLELFGEDGRQLVRQIKTFNTTPGARVNLNAELEFGIQAAAEVGRLVISAQDEIGRIVVLNSVDLILLSLGQEDINPSDALLEDIIIQQPVVNTLVQGGTLVVSGLANPDTDRPLHVEIINDKNQIVGQRLAAVERSEGEAYGNFAVEVPYQVSGFSSVRLVVYEDGEQMSPLRHLSSVEFLISP
jgi:hypothetical protein